MFPVIPAVRLAASITTSLSVGKVVSEVIKNNVSPESALDRTLVRVGGVALSMVIAGAAVNHVESMMSEIRGKVDEGLAKKNATTD